MRTRKFPTSFQEFLDIILQYAYIFSFNSKECYKKFVQCAYLIFLFWYSLTYLNI